MVVRSSLAHLHAVAPGLRLEKNESFDRASWTKAGAAGPACASMAEEYSGASGNFAHESAIAEAIGHVGVDGFGISLHNPPRRFWIL